MAGFIDGCDGVSAVGFLHLQSVLSRRAELAVQNKNAILIRILDGNIGSDGCRLLVLLLAALAFLTFAAFLTALAALAFAAFLAALAFTAGAAFGSLAAFFIVGACGIIGILIFGILVVIVLIINILIIIVLIVSILIVSILIIRVLIIRVLIVGILIVRVLIVGILIIRVLIISILAISILTTTRLLILRGRFFRCLVDQFYVIDIITIAALQGSRLAAFLSVAGQGYDV